MKYLMSEHLAKPFLKSFFSKTWSLERETEWKAHFFISREINTYPWKIANGWWNGRVFNLKKYIGGRPPHKAWLIINKGVPK